MATPTYTYTYDPINVPRDQIRLWIQDTVLFFNAAKNAMTMQIADQEIAGYINECTNLYEAAASCCESIAADYAGRHQYMKMIGDVKVSENYQKQHENYLAIADNIRTRHVRYQIGGPVYAPTALESVAERGQIEQTTDFWTGQFDNDNPVGGADPDVNSLTGD